MMDCCKNEGHCGNCNDGKCDSSSCGCHGGSHRHWRGAKAKLLIRLALGLILVMHGYSKLNGGMDGFTGMVDKLGFPAPGLFAYISALTEFCGGLLVMLGLATRPAAALITINMLVAWGMAKGFALPKGDVDMLMVATAMSLVLSGPGKFSLDTKYCKGGMCMGMMGGKCMGGKCMGGSGKSEGEAK